MYNWQEVLYKSSPQYTEAYQDGYEQAKREMQDIVDNLKRVVDSMQALYETSTTATKVTSEEPHEE